LVDPPPDADKIRCPVCDHEAREMVAEITVT
jgi:hypothetical protein